MAVCQGEKVSTDLTDGAVNGFSGLNGWIFGGMFKKVLPERNLVTFGLASDT
jgi:hypothetical protein